MVIDGTVDIAVICVSLLQVRTVIFQIPQNEYSIYIVLRGSLEEAGFDENFLYQNLIGVAADMLVHILRQIPVAVSSHLCFAIYDSKLQYIVFYIQRIEMLHR